MKNDYRALTAALVLALPLAQGCASLLPRGAPPAARFVVPDAPPPEPAAPDAGKGETFVVGKVRASREADGRAIRTVDAATGRSAFFSDGELVSPPEAVVSRHLRRALAAARPGAVVCDASLVPSGAARTLVECWIEEFRLVRKDGAWRFAFDATLYETPPSGETACRRVTADIPVAAESGREPAAPAVTAAIAKALAQLR